MNAVKRGLLLWLALLAALAFFRAAATRSLWSPDEGRYAEIGREMLATGDWIVPRLNAVRYFEKPPLVYWSIAASLGAFGLNEFAARLPILLSALALLAGTIWLGRLTASRRAGALAALMLAASPMVFTLGQVVILDVPLAALVTLSLCCAWRGLSVAAPAAEPGWARWPLASAGLLALATLAKGPIAVVIAGLVLLPVLVSPAHRPAVRAAPWIGMLAVYLAIAVPWFVLIGRTNPEFLKFFFIHEHFDRYLKAGHARPGGPFYFVPVLVLGLFPWSCLAPAALAARPSFAPGAGRMLAAWFWLPLIFFSLSRSKLPPYVLPVFPPAAVLIGAGLDAALEAAPRALPRRLFIAGVAVVALLLVAVIFKAITLDTAYYHDLAVIRLPALVPLSICALLALAAAVSFARDGIRAALELLGAMTLLGLIGVTLIAPYYEPQKDSRVLAAEIAARRKPGERVAIYGTLESSSALPFYLREPVHVAGHFFGELDMAHDDPRGDEASRFLSPAAIQKWMVPGQPRSWFITTQAVYDDYFAKHPDFRLEEVRRHGNRLVFTNK